MEPYQKVIADIACESNTADRVFVSGSCMGAFGALLCGLTMPVRAMLLTATRFPCDQLPDRLRKAVGDCDALPHCYIEARGSEADREAICYVVDLYRDLGGLCLFRSMTESQEHWAVDLWKPAFTLSLLNILESWNTCQ
jgi:hypothetical protein